LGEKRNCEGDAEEGSCSKKHNKRGEFSHGFFLDAGKREAAAVVHEKKMDGHRKKIVALRLKNSEGQVEQHNRERSTVLSGGGTGETLNARKGGDDNKRRGSRGRDQPCITRKTRVRESSKNMLWSKA